jgi:hypothetical protein
VAECPEKAQLKGFDLLREKASDQFRGFRFNFGFSFAVTAVYVAFEYFEPGGESQSQGGEIDVELQTPVPHHLQEPEVNELAQTWISWTLCVLTSVVALKVLLLLVRPVTLNLFDWSKDSLGQRKKQTQEKERVSSEQQKSQPTKGQECGEAETTAKKSSAADVDTFKVAANQIRNAMSKATPSVIAAGNARRRSEATASHEQQPVPWKHAWMKLGNEWFFVPELSKAGPHVHGSMSSLFKAGRPALAGESAGGPSKPQAEATPKVCSLPRDVPKPRSFSAAPADYRPRPFFFRCGVAEVVDEVVDSTPALKMRPPPGLAVPPPPGLLPPPPGLEPSPQLFLGVYQ